MTRLIIGMLALLAIGWAAPASAEEAAPLSSAITRATETAVIYNQRDPSSVELANYYAQARQIPSQNLIGLDCSPNEEITREEYDRTIAFPLRKAFTDNGWWEVVLDPQGHGHVAKNQIRFVALIRGVPLKIKAATDVTPAPNEPAALSDHNEAAVDSELACLGYFNSVISGPLDNIYYNKDATIENASLASLMLVCRLDGPDEATVRRMIDDSLAAEKNGLNGFCYADARGITSGGFQEGDQWIISAATTAMKAGLPVVLDNGPETFPQNYPMEHAALYYGWYSWNADGPFLDPAMKFVPGAVAVHIHSFSAATLRTTTANWVGPLLAHGAAATMGNVYEPYLEFTPHLDVFANRLQKGYSFAESAYMCERVVSWMTTFVGDPLYTPFPAGNVPGNDVAKEWKAYREGALLWQKKGTKAGEAALQASAKRLKSGIVYEGLGLLEAAMHNNQAACDAFEQARANYDRDNDRVRTALNEINILIAIKQPKEALALARNQIGEYPKLPAVSVLQAIVNKLAPPPPTPTKAPASASPTP
ncbi:MAG: TIGR03790 family protein [Chthoniobacteraceae bacterium]